MNETLNKVLSQLDGISEEIKGVIEKNPSLVELINLPEFQAILESLVRKEVAKQLGEKPVEEPEKPSDGKVILSVDFDDTPEGTYSDSDFQKDFQTNRGFVHKRPEIKAVNGKKALVSIYPKGKWGNDTGMNQWVDLSRFDKELEEVILRYKIRFQEGFDFGLTGKLLGFGFGEVGNVVSGGKSIVRTGGSTVKLVWVKNGKIKPYLYHHGMKTEYGDSMGISGVGGLIPGKEHVIEMRVKANDLGKPNGLLEVKQDGKIIISVKNIEYRVKESPQYIGELALNTFIGGADARFAPDHNQEMALYDIDIIAI